LGLLKLVLKTSIGAVSNAIKLIIPCFIARLLQLMRIDISKKNMVLSSLVQLMLRKKRRQKKTSLFNL
jgi:hypothetical protein